MNSNFKKRYGNELIKYALLFYLFFMICLGLGYSTLNRYDPSQSTGISDAKHYFNMVKSGIQSAGGHWRYRVLIPYAAKPISWLVKNRVGDWNYISFSLLVINSLFCAASALLIIIIGRKLIGDFSVSLTGALFYLLSAPVVNGQLAGLVDSGETFFLSALMLAMITNRWYYLPIIGILGALTKESFVPISIPLALTFLYFNNMKEGSYKLPFLSIIIMIIMSMLSVIIIRSIAMGSMVYPWEIVSQEHRSVGIFSVLLLNIFNISFWYNYIWLIPLGIVRLKYLPDKIIYAYASATVLILFLGAWNNGGAGNISRILFNTIGPLLCLSAALLIFTIFFKENLNKTMDGQSVIIERG
jgi:hypothetical protein